MKLKFPVGKILSILFYVFSFFSFNFRHFNAAFLFGVVLDLFV